MSAPKVVLKAERGKFYRTRDGLKVGPMEETGSINTAMGWVFRSNGVYFTADGVAEGSIDGDRRPEFDLVAEWIDRPYAPDFDPHTHFANPPGFGREVRMIRADAPELVALVAALKAVLDGGYVSESIEEERGDALRLRAALAQWEALQ